VVRVFEVGDESAALPYLAMERLRGEDLAQVLRRETRLSPQAVIELVRHLASGLQAAARAGIVHRDLKPQNVFRNQPDRVGDAPVWKILDFGIATLEHHSGALTVNEVVGTPQYMAPEQARNSHVDARTDLYSLGAIAYRSLTGQSPFRAGPFTEVLTTVMTAMPVRPGALVQLPLDVDLALALALAKDGSDRFSSATELAEALAAAFNHRLSESLRQRAAVVLAKLPWREL
jgi:serine/threonine protein kinase